MTLPSITALPTAPDRSTMTQAEFSAASDAFVAALATFRTEVIAFAAALLVDAGNAIAGVSSVNGETGILTGYSKQAGTETLTNKTLTDPAITGTILEDVYTISDGGSVDIDPGNGSIQFWTLGASRTPTATNFANGESVVLLIADGTAYSVTWSTIGVVWAGGSAPTLPTSGYAVIVLSKAGNVVRGFSAQSTAS